MRHKVKTRHKGSKAQSKKRIPYSPTVSLCAFVPLCLCAYFFVPLCLVLASCAKPRPEVKNSLKTAAVVNTVRLSYDLTVRELADGIWLHTSVINREQYGLVLSNGLLAVTSAGSVLIDTPWTGAQTSRLLDWAQDRLGVAVRHLVITHAHDDRLGGLRTAHETGVVSHGLDLTANLAQKGGWPPPTELFSEQTVLQIGDRQMELFFPGPGYSPDNIVVWLGQERILFGGCLVKDLNSKHLEPVGEKRLEPVGELRLDHVAGAGLSVGHRTPGQASSLGHSSNLKGWKSAIVKVIKKYPHADLVIPGYGEPGGMELLSHTRGFFTSSLSSKRNAPHPTLSPQGRGEAGMGHVRKGLQK